MPVKGTDSERGAPGTAASAMAATRAVRRRGVQGAVRRLGSFSGDGPIYLHPSPCSGFAGEDHVGDPLSSALPPIPLRRGSSCSRTTPTCVANHGGGYLRSRVARRLLTLTNDIFLPRFYLNNGNRA